MYKKSVVFVSNFQFIKTRTNDIVLVGKTCDTLLVCPEIKEFCPKCFEKRILSSTVFDNQKYLKLEGSDFKQLEYILLSAKNLHSNTMYEYKINSNVRPVFIHHLFSVPGCKVCNK